MRVSESRRERAEEFLTEHEPIIAAALRVYAQRMAEAARDAQTTHDELSACPEWDNVPDKNAKAYATATFKVTARHLRQAAETATAARAALAAYMDGPETTATAD